MFKHVEIIREIEGKLQEIADAALKEGGTLLHGAVTNLYQCLGVLVNYQRPPAPPTPVEQTTPPAAV